MRHIGLLLLVALAGCSGNGQSPGKGNVLSGAKEASGRAQGESANRTGRGGPPPPPVVVSVSAASFSPDGKRIIVGYGSSPYERDQADTAVLHIWDVDTGRLVHTLHGQGRGTRLVAFVPGIKQAVSVGGCFVNVWDLRSGKVAHKFRFCESGYSAVALSPDGKALFSQVDGSDQQLQLALHEIPSGKLLARYNHRRRLNSIAFSPDGKWALFSCTADLDEHGFDDKLAMQLWDMQHMRVARSLGKMDPFFPEFPAAFSANGHWFVSGKWTKGRGHALSIWEAQTGKEAITLGKDWPEWKRAVAFTAGGKRILAAGREGLASYDAATGEVIWRLEERLRELTAFCFSPDGNLGLSASGRFTAGHGWDLMALDLWDTVKGRWLRRLKVDEKYSGGYRPEKP
jgi:WD40 repeat protein